MELEVPEQLFFYPFCVKQSIVQFYLTGTKKFVRFRLYWRASHAGGLRLAYPTNEKTLAEGLKRLSGGQDRAWA